MTRVAIIGAGIAGLACARQLMQAGIHPVVFDKGRGIGGRVATRRAGELRFDHGAPYATAHSNDFATVLRGLVDGGNAAPWDDGSGQTRVVGTPGMSSIPKALAEGLDVRLGTQISDLRHDDAIWRLRHGDTEAAASHVVVTVPVPQVAGLLGDAHPLVSQIAGVKMSPQLTLMAAISGAVPIVRPAAHDAPLATIIQNSAKPHRPPGDASTWVAHAGPTFTPAHLEDDLPDIAAQMLPHLCDHLGIAADRVVHAAAHRWRYARVATPLGQPFVRLPDATLYLGGDWCIGPQIEDAWASGTAIATDLLKRGL